MSGKGDTRRPGDEAAFRAGWDRVFAAQPTCACGVMDGAICGACDRRLREIEDTWRPTEPRDG